jgi:signal transduction histidine kinase
MQEALFAELLAALDMVVLERRSVESFRLAGTAPAWFKCFYPDVTPGQDGLRPSDFFPFLANFLVDAEQFWLTHSTGCLRSGLWNETDAMGHERSLEALALCLGEHQLLLLAFPNIEYAEKQVLIQKARENSLAYARLHKEVQHKELLFHCIVHDFAGPLTAIMFSLSFLEAKAVTAASKQMAEICLHQVSRLQRLIQQVLDVFAAEVRPLTAPVPNPLSATDVVGCAQTVGEGLQPSCLHKQVTLQLASAIDTVTDCWVVGDSAHLERVIFNLLENAIRHSPVRAAVRVGITADAAGVLVTVDDEGPGVPPELVDTLFEKFSQARANTGKTGLGLYFCRITIESWGGTIGYTPRATGGAQFWFRLPRAAPPRAVNAAQ